MKRDIEESIQKHNTNSAVIIILLFSVSFWLIIFYVLKSNYNEEVSRYKKSYIENQKSLIKYQENNTIEFIKSISLDKTNEMVKELERKNLQTANLLLSYNKDEFDRVLKSISKIQPLIRFILTDLKGNLIYSNCKDFSKERRKKLIDTLLKNHRDNFYTNTKTHIGHRIMFSHFIKDRYLLSTCIYNKDIYNHIKKLAVNYTNNIRFGKSNNGYIAILKILNFNGGKNFAKVISLPIKPLMNGKKIDSSKKYRQEYLKIINSKKEGYLTFTAFGKDPSKPLAKKITYIKLYEPYNWVIFSTLFLDDIKSEIYNKNMIFRKEIDNIFLISSVLILLIILLSLYITKKENLTIGKIISKYKKQIKENEEKLNRLNKELQNRVQERTNELIKNLFTDSVTSLPNREKLITDLDENCVAILNIDSFGDINDFYGIDNGDAVLLEVGKFLNGLHPVYKLPSDEYALLEKDKYHMSNIIKKINEKIAKKRFVIDNNQIKIDLTAGIGKSLIEADIALKHAKKRGQKVSFFSDSLPLIKEQRERLKWKDIIDTAINSDDIIPYVQPIIDNKTEKTAKYEVLVRLKYKDKIYTPYHFLEISKKSHQYEAIQKIVIEKSFKKFSELDTDFSINLSIEEIKNLQFIRYLVGKIEKYDVGEKLIVELLENEEIMNDPTILQNIRILKMFGVKIAIDDFGSGYSNFAYLFKNIPVDYIKIDGSLIKDIDIDKNIYSLIKHIKEIANNFNLTTVAEFVENESIYQKVKELNIKNSQGYLFGKPFDMANL